MKKMDIKISVIVPIYNVEKYLKQCLESLKNQTYKNIEVIMVNDGSTDNSEIIIKEYVDTDPNFRLINQQNGGLSAARNKGLEYAKGEWIYFCDSDDYVDLNMFEELLDVLDKEDADMCFFDAESFDETSDVEIAQTYARNINYSGCKNGIDLLEILLKEKQYIACVPLHIYKRRFLEKNQLKFQEGILHEDELFSFYAYVNAKKVYRVKKNYYKRRIRVNSITTGIITVNHYQGIKISLNAIQNYYKDKDLNKREKRVVLSYLNRMYEVLYSKVIALDDVGIDMFYDFRQLLKGTKKEIKIKNINMLWDMSLCRYSILESARKLRRTIENIK